MVPQQRGQHGAALRMRTDMGKISVTGTVYLVTVDQGDYYNFPTPFRLYATRVKADRFIERVRRHRAKKPEEPDGPTSSPEYKEWMVKMNEWRSKHPGGPDNAWRGLDAWQVRPMPIC